jgi:hypothetical protein
MTNPTITHDGTLDIATGRSRKELNWKNRQMDWSELVNKLATTHRTAETHAEYLASNKPRQDEIKDIGGFLGGFIAGGRRKAGRITHRQLLTLDVDFADGAFWPVFTVLFDCAAVMYSTHKHAPDKPRLRLIIPLDREVFADEYEAVARKVAGMLDIEVFDPTTFQPERLMYWPSTSKDGQYVFEFQDGPWLCADDILSQYTDWRDSSGWPVSERVGKVVERLKKKQGDPLTKPALIGAFCRSYTIHEAIQTFLGDVYEAAGTDGRYTYKEGSTAAGLITYDDKFAYSHHGTDPTSGILCNAFDLVRIHKFGLQDEDAKADTGHNRLPSFLAMQELAAGDPVTRKQIGIERLAEAKIDFEGVDFEAVAEDLEKDPDWLKDMDADKRGNYQCTINNIVLILQNDMYLKGLIAFDEFEHRAIATRNLPWRKITYNDRFLIDRDDDNIRHYIETAYGINAGNKLVTAMSVIYERTRFHPIRDYLDGLEWDGEERVEHILQDYMGVMETDYTRAVMRKMLCAAVGRAFNPGIKFDYVLVLVGTKQGQKKSTLIDKLGRTWFSDSFTTVQGKDAMEQLQGAWIIEIGELSALRKAEVETIKHFISKREDRFRVAYGHRTENFPRQCVFFASTNNKDFLKDPTGNRRFWPVDVHEIDPVKDVFRDLTEAEIGQIWAEAVNLYRGGEPLYLSPELEAAAEATQLEHTVDSGLKGLVAEFLDKLLPENWEEINPKGRYRYINYNDELEPEGVMRRNVVCIAEIWCEMMGKEQADLGRNNTKDLHEVMRNLEGWKPSKATRKFPFYGYQRAYERSNIDPFLANTAHLSAFVGPEN